MNEDITKLISGMLQNPDALKGLMGSPQENKPAPSQNDAEISMKSMMSMLNQTDDRRITLLNAIKPYMSPTRADGIDRAIRILKLTKLSEMLRNERD
ncbi:MAG: hypothetical protein IJ454_02030 [Clostridia bacterium]|nr:hypothetical protein [Clostridia bacterium]